ncbi:MAG: glycine--tRNA ligase subunit beta [Burkholderiaceae bacterium]|nr:glycine--tRNA ligase subunit beta [Burkholderiaceae bacterium]
MSAALLVELHTEELPPKSLNALSEAFANALAEELLQLGLIGGEIRRREAFGSPRRIAALIDPVEECSPAEPFQQKLMPVAVGLDSNGRPTAALTKKLHALGLSVEASQLKRETDGKQETLVYAGVRPGVPLAAGLQTALERALASLPIAKPMSYQLTDGVTTVQFVRPAHRLVALHGERIVPVKALGLAAGRETCGHRFHARGAISIRSAETYRTQLENPGHVIASFSERRTRILGMIEAHAARLGAEPVMPAELVDEVTALVEWPAVYESGFEQEFLEVPQECLILTMQRNQKYFALKDARGKLLNLFLLVSNIEAADPSQIIAGNARVMRARLADARFFYQQDRRHPLDARLPQLAGVVYHNRLGTLLERVERLNQIAVAVARELGADLAHVERAARLAKADLRTDMVAEFPELQGTMGMHYARHDQEPEDVAVAIEEHYRPRFAGDKLASSVIGICVALGDKLEAMAGLFGIGERPTGDKDPYALRRHALGVLRMLIEAELPLPLSMLLQAAFEPFGERFGPQFGPKARSDLQSFLFDRLRGLLQERGYSTLEVEAVVSLAPDRIDRVLAMLAALRAFSQMAEAQSLAAANKRIGNILKKANAAAAGSFDAFDAKLLYEPAERELWGAFERIAPQAERMLAAADYTGMLRALAPLKQPVDRFFDDVMVMVDDAALRANRLALLAQLRNLMNRVADLSVLAAV